MTDAFTSPEDAEVAPSNRRKACDLCFVKKIKCDMLKPVCSNCILYNSDCKTSIIRRKPNPAKLRQAARAQREEENGRVEVLEDRLARIEGQLQQVLAVAKEAHQPTPAATRTSLHTSPQSNSSSDRSAQSGITITSGADYRHIRDEDSTLKEWRFDPVEPIIYDGPGPDYLSLPPLEEILPVVDHYFQTYNSVIPLFHQPTFMKMLNAWYNHRNARDKTTWAAVQIVMALGYRTPRSGTLETAPSQVQMANECLRNAQSIVSELVTREEDLLGIQILLGIVMLFQNSRDPKPSSVIIGTAVRLAHRLQLHSNDMTQYFTPDEAEQRSRVFWIAYTLDKDISLRARTPSAQQDDDIDVALPATIPTDGAGLIWTEDGQNYLNYHRLRVELSYIEGKVYDLLYSNRATKVKGQERQKRVERLQAQLDQWYSRIPPIFQIENVAYAVGPGRLIQMCKMHHAYLLAEVMTHGIYSSDAAWVTKISSFSRAAIQELSNGPKAFGTASCTRDQTPPLPAGWSKCVEISRGCMKLFQDTTATECLIWQCSCSHFSALIVLLANLSLHPSHPLASLDQHLAAKALHLFDKLLEVVDNKAFQTLRGIIGELYKAANAAVDKDKKERNIGGNDVFEGLTTNLDATHAIGELDFLPLDDDMDTLGGTFDSVDTLQSLDGHGTFSPATLEQLTVPNTLEDIQAMDFSEFMAR